MCECREKTDPPSKNRVWDFFAASHSCAGQNATFTQYPRPENEPTPTATASGARYYGYRFYSPEMGWWLSRDPMGEGGGVNVYGFVKNNPVGDIDPLGLWGREVHWDETYNWATMFTDAYRRYIADGDQGVDQSSGTVPWTGWGISRHMRRMVGGQDSRDYWYDAEFNNAIDALKKSKCKIAAKAFGRGLHSRQDRSSHRAWPDFLGGGDWPTTYHERPAVHPWWWDYYGNGIWGVAANAPELHGKWDGLWLKFGIQDTIYYLWTGAFAQRLSQARAQVQVRDDSQAALSKFKDEVRKSCCAQKMLASP